MPEQQNNFNFNFKLMRGQHLITEQVIKIPQQNIADTVSAGGKTPPDKLESIACQFMYEIERAINSQTGFPLRCHIDQLPPDVPHGAVLDE